MITNPEWHKPKEKPYFHQISMDCLEKLVDCIAKLNKGEIDTDTSCQIEKQILTDEIDDPEFLEFAIDNLNELLSYIDSGKLNIGICRDIECLPPIAPASCFRKKAQGL
jgi:hypothetical protein